MRWRRFSRISAVDTSSSAVPPSPEVSWSGCAYCRADPRAARRRHRRSTCLASIPRRSCPSTKRDSSRSWRTDPRWARASAPPCRWRSRTSSRPTGLACVSCRPSETKPRTADRTRTAREACVTSSHPCAKWAPPRARCSRRPLREGGTWTSRRSERAIIKSSTRRRVGRSDTASSPRPRVTCRYHGRKRSD